MKTNKVYLGDSVYVSHDGFHVVLTTENGGPPSNEIYLDEQVLQALNTYVEALEGKGDPNEVD